MDRRGEEKDLPAACSLTGMAATVRGGPGQSEELGIPSEHAW